MDDQTPAPDPASADSAEDRDRLIESIYRIALEPQSYDSFMARWDVWIADRVAKGYTEPTELTAHFDIASRLLEQSMPPPVAQDAPLVKTPVDSAATAGSAEPRFLVDDAGRVVWCNAAAKSMGVERGKGMERLGLSAPRAAALAGLVAGLSGEDAARPARPVVFPMGDGPTIWMQARVLAAGTSDAIVLIAPLRAMWPAGMDALLASDFGLTPTETAICQQISDGLGPQEIADRRGASIATVRTQIKSILSKTRTSSQPELVRLMHLLMRLAEDSVLPFLSPQAGPESRLRHVMVSGRAMPVEQHGPDDGYPVIFLHGMLDGNAITVGMQRQLEREGLRLICPTRPFFGAATGNDLPIDNAPQQFAQDLLVMIREMRLERPVLVGHMGGSLYAYACATAAKAAGVPIAGIVTVAGGVPILSNDQFASMSARQRLVAYTARYSPRILPFVLRAGIRQMRAGGERKFLMSLYENSPDDLPLVNDPEVQAIVLGGYRFSVAQGHRAFEIDARHVVTDWSALVDGSDTPVRAIHGNTDPVVSIGSVRDFAARRAGRVQLNELPGHGQLVFYKSPELVIDAVRSLILTNRGP